MHPLFEVSDYLPHDIGVSPFHFRGFFYERLLARVKSLDGSLDRLRAELRDDRVRRFLDTRFSWNEWYDAMPLMPIHAALARTSNDDFEEAMRARSRTTLHRLGAVFRVIGDLTSLGLLNAFVTRAVRHTVDFVRLEPLALRDGYCSAYARGIPLYIAPSIASLALGFFEGALRMAGATSVEARCSAVELEGPRGAFATVRMGYEFLWKRA